MPALSFETIDAAIARMEGYYKPGTLAQVNNNPGNLVYGPRAQTFGGVPGAGGFARFPTPSAGFDAMDSLVGVMANRGATYQDLLERWAPPLAPGNTQEKTNSYAEYVAQAMGKTPGDIIRAGAGVLGAGTKVATNKIAEEIFGSTYVRFAIIGLGLIFVLGGVFMFKPAQDAAAVAVRVASKGKVPVP